MGGYHSRAEPLARAAEYTVDGVSHNHRIAYVGDGSPDALQAELVAATPAITEHLQSGNIEVLSTADDYAFRPGTDVLDAEEALTRYLTTVKQALADGDSEHVPAQLIEVLHTARVHVEPFVPFVGDPPAPADSVKLTNSPKVPIAQTR